MYIYIYQPIYPQNTDSVDIEDKILGNFLDHV